MGKTTSKSFRLPFWALFIPVMQSVNGSQFLIITSLFLSYHHLFALAVFSGPPVVAIFPLTSIDASL